MRIRNSKLNRTGLKVTAPRVRILEIFETHERKHLSADDVMDVLRAERCDIGLPTIYRVLSQLTAAGILERHMFDWERARATYELASLKPHGHLVCKECGSVEEFQDEIIESRQQTVAIAHGFEVNVRAHILFGRCRNCPLGKRKRVRWR